MADIDDKGVERMTTVPELQVLNNDKLSDHPTDAHGHDDLPSPIITKRTRRQSWSERALQGPSVKGAVKYFCRQRGHGFITPHGGGDDIFVHITDIEGEFVPHEGDQVAFKTCDLPPSFQKKQAIHVTIKNLAPGVHERWDQPISPHPHPHPEPNTPEARAAHEGEVFKKPLGTPPHAHCTPTKDE